MFAYRLSCPEDTSNGNLEEVFGDDSPLATPKLANDSVVIEVTFIVPADDQQQMTLVWNDIDETHISTKLRTKLRKMEFAAVNYRMPSLISFETLLSGDKNITDPNAQSGSLNLNLGLRNRRLQCSAGSENHVVLSDSVIENLVIIHSDDEYTTAEKFQQAQCQLEFRTYPQGNGAVRLEVVPQIHHGAAKSQFKGHEGAWLLKTQRNIQEYTDLLIDTTLLPGNHYC